MIDKDDYCNRKDDIIKLNQMVNTGKKVVIYAPRRYGKTSLVKNIVGKDFQAKKNHLTVYINLMEVMSLENISERILQALKEVLRSKFPYKSSFNNLVDAFKGMSMTLNVDPLTQIPSVELKPYFDNDKKNLNQIFSVIKNISEQYKLFLIFDEFQDISLIPQAAGILRSEMQDFKTVPMVLLGSKKNLFNNMFASNKSPFFNFGTEINLTLISSEEWLKYFQKRLSPLKINLESMDYLCSSLNNVPNAICEVGSFLRDLQISGKLKSNLEIRNIALSLEELVNSKESTYRYQESLLSIKEQAFMRVLAKRSYILKPTEGSVVYETKTSSGSLAKIVVRLTNKGWIEFEDLKGYRISDPLFSYFLKIKS